MQTGRFWRLMMILVLLLVTAAPTAVFAWEETGGKSDNAALYQQEGEGEHAEEEGVVQDGGSDAVNLVLTLIVGIIALIIFVVAILGAVGLGVIGIGYASVSPGEE